MFDPLRELNIFNVDKNNRQPISHLKPFSVLPYFDFKPGVGWSKYNHPTSTITYVKMHFFLIIVIEIIKACIDAFRYSFNP